MKTAAVAGKLATCSNHSVAWNDDADWVPAYCAAHCLG